MRAPHAIATTFAAAAVLALTPAVAQAQFLGVFNGVSNVIGQVTSKATSSLLAGKGEDLQEAHDKFFGQIDAQTAGMDAAAKANHRKLIEQQWPSMEQALLISNAQLQKKKEAPLLDIGEAANAAVGGAVSQAGLNAAISAPFAGTGGSILSGAMGDIMNTARTASSALVSKIVDGNSPSAPSDLNFKPGKELHPLQFLGSHPSTLNVDELYRENGFLGWKRMEQSNDAAAFAHILGEGQAQYAVYKHDAQTRAMTSAFRVLKVSPAAFSAAVTEFADMLDAQPRYASQGSMLRAVWASGAFVTADSEKISVGWSQMAADTYQSKQ